MTTPMKPTPLSAEVADLLARYEALFSAPSKRFAGIPASIAALEFSLAAALSRAAAAEAEAARMREALPYSAAIEAAKGMAAFFKRHPETTHGQEHAGDALDRFAGHLELMQERSLSAPEEKCAECGSPRGFACHISPDPDFHEFVAKGAALSAPQVGGAITFAAAPVGAPAEATSARPSVPPASVGGSTPPAADAGCSCGARCPECDGSAAASFAAHEARAGRDAPVGGEEKAEPICRGCGKEIDPDCCGCGTSKDHHGSPMDEGHWFIPAGCDCYRAKDERAPPQPSSVLGIRIEAEPRMPHDTAALVSDVDAVVFKLPAAPESAASAGGEIQGGSSTCGNCREDPCLCGFMAERDALRAEVEILKQRLISARKHIRTGEPGKCVLHENCINKRELLVFIDALDSARETATVKP